MSSRATKKIDIGGDDGIIDLKAKERASSQFKVSRIDVDENVGAEAASFDAFSDSFQSGAFDTSSIANMQVKAPGFSPVSAVEEMKVEPKELIKVKFGKFVQLVASRDFTEVLERNMNEDLIISSNLLTELAGSIDEKTERRVPVVFLVGLAIGIVLTYILINK